MTSQLEACNLSILEVRHLLTLLVHLDMPVDSYMKKELELSIRTLEGVQVKIISCIEDIKHTRREKRKRHKNNSNYKKSLFKQMNNMTL